MRYQNRIILGSLCAAVCALCVFCKHEAQQVKLKHKKAVPVTVAVAKLEDISDSINAIGTAISNESVDISSSVTKKVIKIDFEDGQYVHKGDMLVELDCSQEEAEEKRLVVNLDEQEREFNRLEPLRHSGVVSAKDYETQHTKVLSATAELEHIRAKIKETHIIAPFDGLLGMRLVSVGSLVSAGTVVTTIDDIRSVKVDFSVPEKYVLKIHKGASIFATSEASNGIVFSGEIIAVSPRIDEETHNVSVRGIFSNSDLLLRPGMLLKIKIPFDDRQAICVPETAVSSSGNEQFMYIVNDAKAHKRTIKIGTRFVGKVEIVEGIVEGEEFITDGIINIKSGDKVDVK